jgi:1-pyrroline-5-carboxylate dehydrogenase
MVRGAFEFQGQKCSAASRAYVPKSLWPKVKESLLGQISEIKMGSPTDFRNFFTAVIDKGAFGDHKGYIEFAKSCPECTILAGGVCDDSVGYYIQPTIIETADPHLATMEEELFGPVMTIHVYADADYEATLRLCDETSPYGLTGAVFARDRYAFVKACQALRYAAGNFYLNDKPTGAMVGLQPFGGSRGSGTNDKAGGHLNLLRWISPRTIKETFVPPTRFEYPFMAAE